MAAGRLGRGAQGDRGRAMAAEKLGEWAGRLRAAVVEELGPWQEEGDSLGKHLLQLPHQLYIVSQIVIL